MPARQYSNVFTGKAVCGSETRKLKFDAVRRDEMRHQDRLEPLFEDIVDDIAEMRSVDLGLADRDEHVAAEQILVKERRRGYRAS